MGLGIDGRKAGSAFAESCWPVVVNLGQSGAFNLCHGAEYGAWNAEAGSVFAGSVKAWAVRAFVDKKLYGVVGDDLLRGNRDWAGWHGDE